MLFKANLYWIVILFSQVKFHCQSVQLIVVLFTAIQFIGKYVYFKTVFCIFSCSNKSYASFFFQLFFIRGLAEYEIRDQCNWLLLLFFCQFHADWFVCHMWFDLADYGKVKLKISQHISTNNLFAKATGSSISDENIQCHQSKWHH